jgi:broad specificity phosphatase PhoE
LIALSGDIDPTDGISHAKAIANAIASSASPMDSIPQHVYASPFLRTTHTASILASSLMTGVNVEDGLYEYLIPSLLVDRSGVRTFPRTVDQLKEIFENVNENYKACVQITPEMFPEDEMRLIERCRYTLDGILKHAQGANVAIVAHAPCVQALAFVMEGVASTEDSKLQKWPLGGITRFSRDGEDDPWTMDFYGVTTHMPGEYQKGAGLWSLSCFGG